MTRACWLAYRISDGWPRVEAPRDWIGDAMSSNVSVVIPTYNHGRYLSRAIRSVLAQTVAVEEIIVIDDGSTDETAEVLHQFESIRYIYQANRGLSSARNKGIHEAKAEWVAFLDADDWWLPNKIALQLDAAARNPTAALVYTGACGVAADGSQRLTEAHPPDRLWPALRYRNCVTGSGSGVLVQREVLLAAGGFNDALTACEDWDLWVRLARKHTFAAVPDSVVMISVSEVSMSGQWERMLRNTEAILNDTLVCDVRGLRRAVWRRRIRSATLFSASISARTVDPRTSVRLLFQSLCQWPSPLFIPRRWVALGRFALLGKGK